MKSVINQKLREIETKENVKILYCAESGSRAWGFSSPDSDYDVRFIYVRPKEYYLRLDSPRDVIEWQLDDTLDINGWDIKKTLSLLRKSNPTIFEWNNSPTVYKTTPEWERISEIINNYFVEKTGLYHYLNMAKSNYSEYLKTENVKLKKYFYVLRPILACRWILNEGTPPPMLFSELTKKYLGKELLSDVKQLLDVKKTSPEITQGKRIDKLNLYIEKSFEEIEKQINVLPHGKDTDKTELDRIFLSLFS